jgi:iron complex transport system substrate-binding protein
VWNCTLLVLSLCLPLAAQAQRPKPQRIASGTVGSDEILWEILQKDRHRIVAVSAFSENPQYSLLGPIPRSLTGRVGNSVEGLIALRPDLAILASYNKRDLAPQLQAAGIEVLIQSNFQSIEAIFSNILEIGTALQEKSTAESLVQTRRQLLLSWQKERAQCSAQAPTAVLFNAEASLPGQDTTFTSALEAAGFRNIIADRGFRSWVPLSREVLVTLNPDFVVVTSSKENQETFKKILKKDPVWGKMKAIQKNNFIFVPEALLSTVSHHITDLVRLFHKAHPCQSEPQKDTLR